MKNQYYAGTPTSRRFAKCPSTVLAGDAVLVGSEPAVAMNNYDANTGGTVFHFTGTFILTVTAASQYSPLVGAALLPGHKVYASGTLDTVTGVTTGLTIGGAAGDTAFGFIDPAYTAGVLSGVTDTAALVRLGGGV